MYGLSRFQTWWRNNEFTTKMGQEYWDGNGQITNPFLIFQLICTPFSIIPIRQCYSLQVVLCEKFYVKKIGK